MPTLLRLFCPVPLAPDAVVLLSPDQAHYLGQVMRRRVGDEVELFNGAAGGFLGRIEEMTRRRASVRLARRIRPAAQERALTLCFAMIRRGPMETIVQKATELGVTTLQPMVTARTVAKSANQDRLSAIAIEAAEQCERVSVPDLHAPETLDAVLARASGVILFADEAGDDPDQQWGGQEGRAAPFLDVAATLEIGASGISLFIGPEGGFTPEERARLRTHERVMPVALGPRILRADTAAIAALTLIQASLGDWRR